jgi:hypothetical protein
LNLGEEEKNISQKKVPKSASIFHQFVCNLILCQPTFVTHLSPTGGVVPCRYKLHQQRRQQQELLPPPSGGEEPPPPPKRRKAGKKAHQQQMCPQNKCSKDKKYLKNARTLKNRHKLFNKNSQKFQEKVYKIKKRTNFGQKRKTG